MSGLKAYLAARYGDGAAADTDTKKKKKKKKKKKNQVGTSIALSIALCCVTPLPDQPTVHLKYIVLYILSQPANQCAADSAF